MIKIQVNDGSQGTVLQVEGRLAGAFAAELEHCWRQCPTTHVAVDLGSVTCVDREGRRLLRTMHRSGVQFLRAGLGVQDVLEEVMEEECRQ